MAPAQRYIFQKEQTWLDVLHSVAIGTVAGKAAQQVYAAPQLEPVSVRVSQAVCVCVF